MSHSQPDLFISFIQEKYPGRIDYLNKRMRDTTKVDWEQEYYRLKGAKQGVVKFDSWEIPGLEELGE